MRQKRLQQIVLIVSIIAFIGSTGFGMAGLFTNSQKTSEQDAKTAEANSQVKQLTARERGFELVLTREPNNQVALEGLVQVRLAKKDLKGAVEPMEKLVKLNPDKADYKTLLAEVKQRASQEKPAGKKEKDAETAPLPKK